MGRRVIFSRLKFYNATALLGLSPGLALAQSPVSSVAPQIVGAAIIKEYAASLLFFVAVGMLSLWYVTQLEDSLIASSNQEPIDADTALITDGITGKPLAYAEIVTLSRPPQRFLADMYGRVPLTIFPADGPVRIAKPGYRALTWQRDSHNRTIGLVPSPSPFAVMALYYLQLLAKIVGIATLLGATLLTLSFTSIIPNSLSLFLLVGCLCLWLLVLKLLSRKTHRMRVVDADKKKPIPFAFVILNDASTFRILISNYNGELAYPYPLPDYISVCRYGYEPLVHYNLAVSAITADGITLHLTPQDSIQP